MVLSTHESRPQAAATRRSANADPLRPARIGVFLAQRIDQQAISLVVSQDQRPKPDYMALNELPGFDFVSLHSPMERFFSPSRWMLKLIEPASGSALKGIFKSHDAILALGEDVGIPLALSPQNLLTGKPLFIVCHGTYFDSKLFAAARRLVRRMRSVHFLALSKPVRDQLIGDFKIPAERCHTIGASVDTAFYRAVPLPERAGIVSAGVVNRDYKTLFSAVESLDVDVQIAVNSSWVASAKVEASPPANVHLCEPPLGIGLRQLYEQASIVVVPLHPVRYASGYSTIMEAMAVGRPVITTRTAGQTEIVVDGENGFLVDPHDAKGLREKIECLMSDPGLARRMGEAGRATIERSHSLPRYTARVASVISTEIGLGDRIAGR